MGQAIRISCLEQLLNALGKCSGISHGDIVKSYLGHLGIAKSDFEASEGNRSDKFFQAALGIEWAPSSARPSFTDVTVKHSTVSGDSPYGAANFLKIVSGSAS